MSDLQLLESAARAAGLPWDQWVIDGCADWNALHYDGDAFGLVINLRLTVMFDDRGKVQVSAADPAAEHCKAFAMESLGSDPAAAARRAIVRAAAEIGRAS